MQASHDKQSFTFTNQTASSSLSLDDNVVCYDITGTNSIHNFKVSGSNVLTIASGQIGVGTITPTQALDVIGGIKASTSLTVGSTTIDGTELSVIDGVTAGTASASKALVLDSNSGISGIGSLSATTLGGTLSTASQPNITSVGTLSSLSVSGELTLGGSPLTTTQLNYIVGITPGTASASKALVLSATSTISGIANIGTTALTVDSGQDLKNAIFTSTKDTNVAIIANSTQTVYWPTLDLIRQNTSASFGGDNFTDWRIRNKSGTLLLASGSTTSGNSGDRFAITETGNIGIANTAPLGRFHVFAGSGTPTSGAWYRAQVWESGSAQCDLQIATAGDAFAFGTFTNHGLRLMTNNATTLFLTNGNNVGIGSTSDITPESKLHVDGTSSPDNNGFRMLQTWQYSGSTAVKCNLKISPAGICHFGATSTNADLFLLAGNSVRISLYADGTVTRSNNASTFNTTSDYRVKTNIIDADLNLCYDNIKNLKLKYYTYIPEFFEQYTDINDRTELGWIAQEVEGIFPKAVTKSNQFGYEDFRTLNTDMIMRSLYGCVQKVIKDKEALENEVADLKEKNKQMELQIQQILERLNET